MKEIRGTASSNDSEVANSVMAVGKQIPAPGKELILPEGAYITRYCDLINGFAL